MTTLVSYVYLEEQSIKVSDEDARLLKQNKVALADLIEKYTDTKEVFDDWVQVAHMEKLD
jgi:hypothetical protein